MLRREFLQTAAGAGLAVQTKSATAKNCIVLLLVGGPSQLDTWDMKPDAPREIRGPFRPIRTNVSGVEISEIFPRMARHADKYALVRSVWHDGPSLHDAGLHLLQTGSLPQDGAEQACVGSVFGKTAGIRPLVLPFAIGSTGGDGLQGQGDGWVLAEDQCGLHGESAKTLDRYGSNRFGRSCLAARKLVEAGNRFVTVNMFSTVFDETTWDSHGYSPFSPLSAYRDHVGPMFDAAYSSLLEDLSGRGSLEDTLVVAMGEFGRTPKLNPGGGRDHWTRCSTIVLAGGGVRGGQVYGSSDKWAAEPIDDPVHAGRVAPTILHALGLPTAVQPIPVFS